MPRVAAECDCLVVGCLVAAVGGDFIDDLVHCCDQILVALRDDDGLTEGSFLCGELEVGDLKLTVAVGYEDSPTAWSTTRPAMLPFCTSSASAGYFSSSKSSLSGSADWMSWDWMVPFCAPTFWPARASLVE